MGLENGLPWQPGVEACVASVFYRHLDPDELADRGPLALVGPVRQLLALAENRPLGAVLVTVSNPTEPTDGWTVPRTVIQIVADDMPFLVDSVTAELTRQEVGIHMLSHPVLAVTRDAAGQMLDAKPQQFADLDAPADSLVPATSPSRTLPSPTLPNPTLPNPTLVPVALPNPTLPSPTLVPAALSSQTLSSQTLSGQTLPRASTTQSATTASGSIAPAQIESWMHIEVDWQPDLATRVRMEQELRRVLGDVVKAVADWPAMLVAARAVAAQLSANPPPSVAAWEISEAVALLNWLVEDHFTFLGYRPYRVQGRNGDIALVADPDSGLGILRSPLQESTSFAALPEQVRARALEPHPLILTKANHRSTVHRGVYLDYVGIKMFDDAGQVIGEHRFLGLFAASAYTASVNKIPVISRKARELRAALGVTKGSHTGRDLQQFLQTFPRDELFAAETDYLRQVAEFALGIHERRATRLFVRHDPYQRFLSCLIYLPRDRYDTDVRLRVQQALMSAVDGANVEYTARVTESVLARLHVVVRMSPGRSVPDVDLQELENRIVAITRSWTDELASALLAVDAQVSPATLLWQYPRGFPEAYKEVTTPIEAIADLQILEHLSDLEPDVAQARGGLEVNLLAVSDPSGGANIRLKLYSLADISLARVLPVLNSIGAEIVAERPYRLCRSGPDEECEEGASDARIYDLRLLVSDADAVFGVREAWQDAFQACWSGLAETDTLNRLVAGAGLTWQEVAILRAFSRYLRQAGSQFSQAYIENAQVTNPQVARQLVAIFRTRLDPKLEPDARAQCLADLLQTLHEQLAAVASLDQDRILRSLHHMIMATLRTNYFQPGRPALAMKLDPMAIPDLPEPRPRFEIWVYSPRVEGVHLRYGLVARGGLRWSDRREDFRTEILGLAKAQAVKNAVIVPVGAKGGFFAKALPNPSDRDAWLAEGIAAYRIFVGSLLDVTDNLVGGQVVPPEAVVRHDGDDTYLVVAADKGTATFSDIANEVAQSRGYWLGDAFASGGSAGYDHKEMGITARGAWESVRAHLRSLGVDPERQDFTVVGIGDMSGDVFGNAMLLSSHIRLVAAFDHRHLFLDPDPDAAASYQQRKRLFGLPRSSWADYDPALISPGGGVFPRGAKAIAITEQVRRRLALADHVLEMTPAELLQAILRAPVDLLFNGGIGTYVKASSQSNQAVGDRANDAIRINGSQLRARAVGEGGNLGMTQLGRIEAAEAGVLLNTDSIDNSAGVDTSDHEVNIKILLDQLIVAGALAARERVPLLDAMTDEVAALVLAHNVAANVVITVESHQAALALPANARLIRDLSARAGLDRSLEALPDDDALRAKQIAGQGLSRPEIAVVMAYAKLDLKEQLLDSPVPDEAWAGHWLESYFPRPLLVGFGEHLSSHPLRRQIIATGLANEIVNRSGMTFVLRTCEETGASAAQVARAFWVSCQVFALPQLWEQFGASSGSVAELALNTLRIEAGRLLDRATRWFLGHRGGTLDVNSEIARFRGEVTRLACEVPSFLLGVEQERLQRRSAELAALGAPAELASQTAALLDVFSLLDVVEVAHATGTDAREVAQLYFTASERYEVDLYLSRIAALPRTDRWSSLARAALRADLYGALAVLTGRVIRATPEGGAAVDRLISWEQRYAEGLARARATLDQIGAGDVFDLATLSVAMRTMRTLAMQGG